ncbi:M20/M25/M40 family metallo-hydrolase [Nocardioides sp. R-C-SC26]|uniref:M20/M25/M40 family metallo-hydrolase n=1 Tax=Nocardioides sp. R-C-SC26 TaxID=2870414 RepID=UPI001E53EDAF|nr:M20/M25/M40 family metallo-hydrolase [Nocardioides sp. R-C-SC26]
MSAPESLATPAQRLAALVRHRTVSEPDEHDPAAFAAFRETFAAAYPRLHGLETVCFDDGTLLFHLPGESPERPMVLMAHHDVVPAPAEQWSFDPFAGVVTDTEVFGRGTLDDKGPLVCIAEAVERLLGGEERPAHDVWVLSGADEETVGYGASRAADHLRDRGVHPWLVADEGGAIVTDHVPGATGPVALVGVAEKGSVDVGLLAIGGGGHTSIPLPDGAVARLARAIVAIDEHAPELLVSRAVEAMAAALGLGALDAGELGELLRGMSHETAALVSTTMAVTRLSGSPADNVVASEARATVNVRLAPGDDRARLRERLEKLLAPHGVLVDWMRGDDPSPVSRTEGPQWAHVVRAAGALGDHPVVPYVQTGATDSRFFSRFCDAVYRFAPLSMDAGQRASIHGPDERVSIASLELGAEYHRSLLLHPW